MHEYGKSIPENVIPPMNILLNEYLIENSMNLLELAKVDIVVEKMISMKILKFNVGETFAGACVYDIDEQ